MAVDDSNDDFMQRALVLAERGRGGVEPNPMVGAVVVANGEVVGEGWHRRFGGPHAEIVALDAAGKLALGADLYVTLEPCCHTGQTPPCTDRVIAAGIRRVVAAMADPFHKVAGGGIERLKKAGIDVQVGMLEDLAKSLNAPYLKLLATGRPYVLAKWAMTLDGRVATAGGESKWITGDAARAHSAAFRGYMDAVIVGVETAIADDPKLTARPKGPREPAAIVVDSQCRLPLDSQLTQAAKDRRILVATTRDANESALEKLANAGVEILMMPNSPLGRVDIEALLAELGKRRFTNVLVEGGSKLLGSFFDQNAIDAVRVYMAPKVFGGFRAPGPIGGFGVSALSQCLAIEQPQVETIGDDYFLCGRISKPRR